MSLKVLSYLGIRSDKLNDWSNFAGGLLGMQKIDKGGNSMAFRMDSQEQHSNMSRWSRTGIWATRSCENARLFPSSS